MKTIHHPNLRELFSAYVWWFNNKRLHSSLGYVPPIKYRKMHS
ncbi:IS3 family transposase [Erysipelothrix larvae]